MFSIWAWLNWLPTDSDETKLSSTQQWTIGFVVAYGFFHLFACLTAKLLENIHIIKRIVFGSSYFEGTWVGYYFAKDNVPAIIVQKMEQSIDCMHISAIVYYDDKTPKRKWKSIGKVSVDTDTSSLLYMYESNTIYKDYKNEQELEKKTLEHGFGVFEFQQKPFLWFFRNPCRLIGYTRSRKKVNVVLTKVSDNVCINSEDDVHEFVQKALNFYQLDTKFHPYPSPCGKVKQNEIEQQRKKEKHEVVAFVQDKISKRTLVPPTVKFLEQPTASYSAYKERWTITGEVEDQADSGEMMRLSYRVEVMKNNGEWIMIQD